MDALELINQNLDENNVSIIFSHYNMDIDFYGDIIRSACPIHNGSNMSAFTFSLTEKMFYCHSCGAYGDIVQFIQYMNDWNKNEDFPKAVNFILELLGLSSEGLEIKAREDKLEKDVKAWKKFIKKLSTRRKVDEYIYPNIERKSVIKFRAFDKVTLRKYKLEHVQTFPITKKDGMQVEVKNKLAMPILFYGKIVGVALRRANEADFPKWLFQPTNLDKRNLIYNLQDKTYENITVCEGIFDVWAFEEIGVEAGCVLGKNITDEQKALLQKHTLDVILAYDGDRAGREATCMAIIQLKNSFNLRIVNFADGEDPENVKRERLEFLYDNRIHYLDWIKEHKKDWDDCLKKHSKSR